MECFTVYADEIQGRMDPFYYSKVFIENEKVIKNSRYQVKTLEEISRKIVDGPFGSQLKVEEYVDRGIPLIRVKNVKNGELQEHDFVYITPEKQQQLKRSKVKPNDIILTKAGSIGNSCVVPPHIKEANITSHLAKIEAREEINPKYICEYLNTKFGRRQIERQGNKTTRPELNLSEVSSTKIVLPPSEIQNRIVQLMGKARSSKKSKETKSHQLLDSINDYVLDTLEIKVPKLEDTMDYVVNSEDVQNKRIDAYYYRPSFKEVEEAIEKGKFEVKDLGEFITEIHYGASVGNIYVEEGIPILRISNLKENKVDLSDVVKLPGTMKKELGNVFVKEGDLLISRSGTIGIVAVIPKEADGYAFGSFMIRFCLNDKINKYYVSAWLNTKLQKLLTEREKIGAIQGNITIPTIESFRISLPSLSIQNKIAEEVKKRVQRAEQLQKEAKDELEKAKEKVEKIVLS